MDKAIYGLAMAFNQFYGRYDARTNIYKLELPNYEVTDLWEDITLTLEHNKYLTIGSTRKNLSVLLSPKGLFFRFIPDTPEGLKAYLKVKRGRLRHCSVTYLRRMTRNYSEGDKINSLARLLDLHQYFTVDEHHEALVHEICLTNTPANPATFCTTDVNHPLLREVIWDEVD